MQLLIHVVFSFIATVAFGVITNIPRRALLACGVTGCFGWVTYWLLHTHGVGMTLANFAGAVIIGVASIVFSRKMAMPMIIFNIPSLVPLVPGGPAYMAVREIMLGSTQKGLQNMLTVIATAGSIAVGFMVTNLIEKLFKKYRQFHASKKSI